MQIHELNRPRRTDEGAWDVVKGVGKAAATGLGHSIAAGAGYNLSKNSATASAGILDPKQKLAAVMKEPAMVKLATDYADEWLKLQSQAVPEQGRYFSVFATGATTNNTSTTTSYRSYKICRSYTDHCACKNNRHSNAIETIPGSGRRNQSKPNCNTNYKPKYNNISGNCCYQSC